MQLSSLKLMASAQLHSLLRRRCPTNLCPSQLLVTLLLWNAVAMEALPVFLDKLLTPYSAIIISVTMVLLFGAGMASAAVCPASLRKRQRRRAAA